MVDHPAPTKRLEKSAADLRLMQVREQIGVIIADLKKLAARPQDPEAVAAAAALSTTLAALRHELFAAMSSTDKLK